MIQVAFQKDHEEIDVLFSALRRDVKMAAERGSGFGLVEQFAGFDSRLERHIHWEEEILFPAVEGERPELIHGPGQVMRMEHEEIRRLKKSAVECLKKSSNDSSMFGQAGALLEQVLHVLQDHNMKEEQIYYPMADSLLSEARVRDILSRTTLLKA